MAWGFPFYMLALAASLSVGWALRGIIGIESETGLGYWLGIAGASCLGILLIYPVRKRVSALAFIGSVPAWFHLHMAMGLLAPTLILFHSNFRVGSVNASVALTAMLIVAFSGLIGRFLYARVHKGLTGQKAEAKLMVAEAARLRTTLVYDFADVADIAEELEDTLHTPRKDVFAALGYAMSASGRITKAKGEMLRAVRRGAREIASAGRHERKKARQLQHRSTALVNEYCRTLKRSAYLVCFERLFALWHVAHLPLFFLMVIAAVIHVVAVHLY